jgi:flagella basal body P-ring formation protein FlgA
MNRALVHLGFALVLTLPWISWGPLGGWPWSSLPCEAQAASKELIGLSRVEVGGEEVTLLDLFEKSSLPEGLKGVLAQKSIGPSPSGAEEKFVQGDRLREYLQTVLAQNGWEASEWDIRLPERITVVRRSVGISREDIEGAFREFILSHLSREAGDVAFSSIHVEGNPALMDGLKTYRVNPSSDGRYLGDVELTVDCYVDGKKSSSVKVAARVELYRNVVHSRHPLKRYAVVESSDIELKRINVADGAEGLATQPEQIIGKRLLRDVGFLEPMKLGDFDEPLMLKRGNAVTIIYLEPGLKVTASGKALMDGSRGNVVRVTNLKSKRTIDCKVIDAETVQAIP